MEAASLRADEEEDAKDRALVSQATIPSHIFSPREPARVLYRLTCGGREGGRLLSTFNKDYTTHRDTVNERGERKREGDSVNVCVSYTHIHCEHPDPAGRAAALV